MFGTIFQTVSYDVHRNKCISGCFILRHLVELCFEYGNLPRNDSSQARAGEQSKPRTPQAVSQELQKAKEKRKEMVGTTICRLQGNVPGSKLVHYHESVAILRKSGLRDESGNLAAGSLIAPRIHDTHSITSHEPSPESFQLSHEAFGTLGEDHPNQWSGDVVLNLDMKKFGLDPSPNSTENTDFEELPTPQSNSNLITRLVIPRSAVNDPKQRVQINSFIKGHLGFLNEYNDSRKPDNDNNGSSVLVISSESLRNTGLDISYRVTWERSVSGIVRYIRNSKAEEDHAHETWDLGRRIRHLISKYDYIVVCFYNDGALIVPTETDSNTDGDAILVADPEQIEGDHSRRFTDTMRGTETLLTASIAFHLRQNAEATGGKTPKHFIPKCQMLNRIRKGTIHGIKASRYLQSHGYVTLHHCVYRIMDESGGSRSNEIDPDGKEKAYQAMSEKLASSSADIVRYFWNRTRSTAYALEGLIVGSEQVLREGKTKETKFCTWPLGDLAEILASGHPTYGSFPPVGLRLEEGREEIERETRRVNDAWNDSGWLEVGRFRWKDVIREGEEKYNGYPYWSLREVAVNRLTRAVQSAKSRGTATFDGKSARSIALALLCEMIVRFGTKNLNRKGMSPEKQFDYELVKRVLQFHFGELKTPDFYGNCFRGDGEDGAGFDPISFLNGLAESTLDSGVFGGTDPTSTSGLLKVAFGDESHLTDPTSGSLLGIFPEFSVRKFHTFDGRDTQSFRDIRERLLNFQASEEKKPLNLLVLGSPGSGKSFGVMNIIEGVFGPKDVEFLEYNVASFSGNKSSLTSAFLEIQNVGHQGKMPVVFWDEFDTSVDGIKLSWLASFLGPMQDGKFLIDQSSRYLPKCVFVFAGSVFSRFEQIRFLNWLLDSRDHKKGPFATTSGWTFNPEGSIANRAKPRNGHDQQMDDLSELMDFAFDPPIATQMGLPAEISPPQVESTKPNASVPASRTDWAKAKGRDFKSRITGVLDIASVDPRTSDEFVFGLEEDRDAWLFRRAAAVRQSFEKHAGHLLNSHKELQISESTIFSFLTVHAFDHGYRSIENMVRMSSLNQRAIADGSVVPTEAQVRIHCRTDLFSSGQDVNFEHFGELL